MHDGHEGETEHDDRAIGDFVQSKRLFDAKNPPEPIEHLKGKDKQSRATDGT